MITPHQKLFFQFASVEYEGLPYMTPQDFLESVTEDHPRRKMDFCDGILLSFGHEKKIKLTY